MSDNISFDNLMITDNMVLAVACTRETFDLKQAANASANALQSQHFQVLAPKSSLIEEIYIGQADCGQWTQQQGPVDYVVGFLSSTSNSAARVLRRNQVV